MPGMDPWFVKIELELGGGRSILCPLTRDETAELAKRFFAQESTQDDIALARAAFSTLVERIERGSGELVLPDANGRVWIVPATSVIAIGFEHRLDVPGRKQAVEFGFRGKV